MKLINVISESNYTTSLVVKQPSECTKKELDSFENAVSKGGEVVRSGLRSSIMSAKYLIFLYLDPKIDKPKTLAGVIGLKIPNDSYKKTIFRKAKSTDSPDDFAYEIGWLYVEKEFRGRLYSRLLFKAAINDELSNGKGVFITTRESNRPYYLSKAGFWQSGEPYKSTIGNHNLVLYVKK